jgi:hypothetical protein
MKIRYGGVLMAAVLLGGCATKQEVHTLHGDVGMMQQEWEAFKAGYDPAMREELRRNLELLKERNAEIALLRDESRRNADRVAELLAQIDHNAVDRAVVECRRTASEASRFAGLSQQQAELALGYAEEMRHMTRQAIRHHMQEEHKVDTAALLARLRSMETKVRKLEQALKGRKEGERKERSGR